MVSPLLNGAADVVVPSRTDRSWKSYPSFQQESESAGNKRVGEFSGRIDLDVFFGPVAASIKAANLIIESDPKILGFEDTYVPQYLSSWAQSKMLKVISVPVDFIYPPDQKVEEEKRLLQEMKLKRQNQLEKVVQAHRLIFQAVFQAVCQETNDI